ncbi:DEAD/DEAH box helicase [Flavobacterium zepuense]|uniref:DEAD/DEAH box helicase n=1 Tax=Flavobacterium zepuense TaxID=2593302 RepID=A0A552UYG4_9FLAO|nr:DEAD/DEAH box helicase [Flavobacterium zepuense]TRW23258.1 DEAD/DEAH box helicase [Flavobacterium zepuense]
MFLKKINPNLSESLADAGLTEPTSLQKETFGTIKSGVDCVISAPSSEGKTTAIVINVIQRLEKEFQESPRALIIVSEKAKVLEVIELFKKYGNHTNLRVYGVHEKGDIDYDKNQISLGIDVLVGTPGRLSEMFSSAGFDVNQLKMFILDEASPILKLRHDTRIMRMSDGIAKTQRLFFTEEITERVESLADRIMIEPLFFDFDEEEDEEEYDDEETEEQNEE